jgi:hypothetical protein
MPLALLAVVARPRGPGDHEDATVEVEFEVGVVRADRDEIGGDLVRIGDGGVIDGGPEQLLGRGVGPGGVGGVGGRFAARDGERSQRE